MVNTIAIDGLAMQEAGPKSAIMVLNYPFPIIPASAPHG